MTEPEALRNFDLRTVFEFFREDSAERPVSATVYDAVLTSLHTLNLRNLDAFAEPLRASLRTAARNANAERELDRLIRLGVREETLVAAMMLFRLLPAIDGELRSFMGEERERKRKAKILLEAAQIMDEFAASVPTEKDGGTRETSSGLAMPKLTADSLHFYPGLLSMREQFLDALDANSGEEIAKFTLASAVKRITGRFHDREVSGITGVILSKDDYDETAHRVWRNRTLTRLEPTCSVLPTLLHAFNSALIEQLESAASPNPSL